MKEIAKKILEKIKFSEEDSAIFDLTDDAEIKLKKENFHRITKKETDKKLIFIDGGNLEIMKAPSFSLFFNRIYFTVYQNNKRTKNKLFEFYSLITSKNKAEKIYYETEYFFTKGKLDLKPYEFYSFDKSLIIGNRRVQISAIGDVIRRFAEIETIKETKEEDAFIILDGTLEAIYPGEKELLEKTYNTKNKVCAITKTSNQITRKGSTLNAYLLSIAPEGGWYYAISGEKTEQHKAETFFMRLNAKSDYVFRLDIYHEIVDEVSEILSLLEENSKDPIFLGYPYGMIEADRFARVTKKEKESLQLQLKMLFGKEFNKIKPFVNTLNAHDILDNIS